MRTYRARVAVLAALLVTLLASASASATTIGIKIALPQLVTQRGLFTFREPLSAPIICNSTLTKTLVTEELIQVRPLQLVKLGKVTSGVLECIQPAFFLNLARQLGRRAPGPNPESWDISFLSSNLPGGELNFGILDFQVQLTVAGFPCLYRGTLLGTLSTNGNVLRYASNLPLFLIGPGCPPTMEVEGTFLNEPAIAYTLLP